MKEPRLTSFREFWPFYLSQHRHARTRQLHVLGTSLGVLCVLVAWSRGSWGWFLAAPALAYALAWVSHFWIEKNRPATFTYPLWSFLADLLMTVLFFAGRLDEQLRRHGFLTPATAET